MTLQEICLSTIVKSFDRYYHAYSTTDNEDLQRKFIFLQRVYSEELLSRLFDENRLREKYAGFVFNKYLKYIHTKWFSTFSWNTVAETFARIGPSLEKVVFRSPRYFGKEEVKLAISHLPNVRDISYRVYCNNNILRHIAEYCPRLETLDVMNCRRRVTDDGLQCFIRSKNGKGESLAQKEEKPCPLLREIFLRGCNVKCECIKQLLENFPSLERIDHYGLPIALYEKHKDDVGSLQEIERYNLTHLDLTLYIDTANYIYGDTLKICVNLCPNLKDLTLFYCGDESDFLMQMGGKLTSLTLRKCNDSLSRLEQSHVQPKRLTVDDRCIQYNDNDIIPRFDKLKEFNVDGVNLSNSCNCIGICRILKSSPVLEKLCFEAYSSFTSEMKIEILKCCERGALKYIEFICSPVEREFLKDILLTRSSLETLSLDEAFVPDELLEDLHRIAKTVPNRPKILVDYYNLSGCGNSIFML